MTNRYIRKVKLKNKTQLMDSFAAIDFETANEYRSSVCSVGVVVVRNGKITDSFYSLVRPEPEFYRYWNTKIHGISFDDTANASVFPYVWQQIEPLIQGLPLIAHNKGFDESCLKACFKTYQMDYPEYEFLCTLQSAKKLLKGLPDYRLHTVSAHCGFMLNKHHHALADAEECARIAMQVLSNS